MTLYLGRDSIWDMFERSIWLPYIKAHMVKFLTWTAHSDGLCAFSDCWDMTFWKEPGSRTLSTIFWGHTGS